MHLFCTCLSTAISCIRQLAEQAVAATAGQRWNYFWFLPLGFNPVFAYSLQLKAYS